MVRIRKRFCTKGSAIAACKLVTRHVLQQPTLQEQSEQECQENPPGGPRCLPRCLPQRPPHLPPLTNQQPLNPASRCAKTPGEASLLLAMHPPKQYMEAIEGLMTYLLAHDVAALPSAHHKGHLVPCSQVLGEVGSLGALEIVRRHHLAGMEKELLPKLRRPTDPRSLREKTSQESGHATAAPASVVQHCSHV